MLDPRQPVLIGAHELAVRTADAEPIEMMVAAVEAAFLETDGVLRSAVDAVRVVKGIWPYKDPGRLVAHELGLPSATTAITQLGGNATYDLVNKTATDIMDGAVDVVIVCGAETMRTRRKDKAEGRKSSYRDETESTSPDLTVGADVELVDQNDIDAEVSQPVHFYAMAESSLRHRRSETPPEHLSRISSLWAEGSAVATKNPHAWIADFVAADRIASPGPDNRMVAAPYSKLLTSNINVDQAAALVMCSYGTARSVGIQDDKMVYLLAGSGAYDQLAIRERQHLDRSPAFRLSSERAFSLAGLSIDEVTHLDLYSCFPSSVQLAQHELGISSDRPFTITGGLTFAGGPYNGYCTQALAHATSLLRGTEESAFLYGNGGYFTKHSVLLLSGVAPEMPYRNDRPQSEVDQIPPREPAASSPESGTIEAYTVTYDRDSSPLRAILSVLDAVGSRTWAHLHDQDEIHALLASDHVGREVQLTPGQPPNARLL